MSTTLTIAGYLPASHRACCARHDPTPGPCDCGWKPVPLVRLDDAQRAIERAARTATPAMPPTITRSLLAYVVDEVFDGAIEDVTVIEDIYRVIARSVTNTQEAPS